MADPIVYLWNPFQERADCRVPGEVIKPNGVGTRVEFVPRAAPFYAHNFKLFRQGSNEELILGVDFIFGHAFDRFIHRFKRNVYGSVILLKPVNAVLLADYDTIGGPFILDQGAYATLVANINNAPRQADWSEVVDIPYDFPADPHEQPAAQTYDYLDMVDYLKNLVLAITETGGDHISVRELLEEHLTKDLDQAHKADQTMIGLDLVPNCRKATIEDIVGNSDNVVVTMKVVKEMFRQLAAGTLPIGGGSPTSPPLPQLTPPTTLNAPSTVLENSIGNILLISGGKGSTGEPVTYTLVQSGAAGVIFSKTSGITEGEQVTFSVSEVLADTEILISAVSVDSSGGVSDPKTVSVIVTDVAPTGPGLPGSLFGGGYYMGDIVLDNIPYALINAPKALGEYPELLDKGQADVYVATLRIAGHADWIIPTLHMSDIIYRVTKPTAAANRLTVNSPYTEDNGVNPQSVPPGVNYTGTNPGQTPLALYQQGGPEAFKLTRADRPDRPQAYWTNTIEGRYGTGAGGEHAFRLRCFVDGDGPNTVGGYPYVDLYKNFVRAVRLVRL